MNFPTKAPWKRAEVWLPLLTAGAFLLSLRAGYVFDDARLIVENAYVHAPGFWSRAFTTHFWDVSNAAPRPSCSASIGPS
jgi:hypothetical protein